MITNRLTINAIPPKGVSPIDVAIECYKKWKTPVPFEKDLAEYLRNGIVISLPDVFQMLKIIDLRPEDENGNFIGDKPEPGWYVRMAVGELGRLVETLPGYLPKICFCRRNNPRLRVYSLDRLIARIEGGQRYG
jgi:hypothetical protein